jgi:hypothetical protein
MFFPIPKIHAQENQTSICIPYFEKIPANCTVHTKLAKIFEIITQCLFVFYSQLSSKSEFSEHN